MRKFSVPVVLVIMSPIQAQQVVSSGRGWYHSVRSGKDDKATLLARGDRLSEGESLTSGKESGDLILDCPRQGWLIYSCSGDACKARACIEESQGGVTVRRALLARVTQMFAPLLRREPAELAVAGVRGLGSPSNAVVVQTPQGVHWAPALIRVLEGDYCFRLTHVPASGPSGAREFTLDWDRSVEKEGIVAIPNLSPGLYRLEKGAPAANGACRLEADSTPAWVLVTPQAQFNAIDKQWEDDSAKIDELEQSGVSTSALTTLRHAALATLADSVEGK